MRKIIFLALFSSVLTTSLFAQGTMPGAIPAWAKGPSEAAVTVEVFNDYACPACAYFDKTLKSVAEKYPNELQIIYRQLPLKIEGHENARLAAQAVEAAGMQGKFWEMSDLILEKQDDWRSRNPALDEFIKYAEKLELDIEQFKADITGEVVKQRINSDIERVLSLKIGGTPTIIVNGEQFSYDDINSKEKLEELIKKNISKINKR
jgi:protein-disulfide isomerase